MQIKNPFKDYFGRWKDDITITEKIIWSMLSVMLGIALVNFIFYCD